MNEELKALLKEAYDRGASREQLDAIVERYNASKKKEQPQEPFQFGASDTPSAVPSQEVPEVKQHKKSFLDYLSESSPIGAGPADLRETTALRDQPKLMDILKENPEYGNKMVNRSVAAAKTGILLAESDAGLRSVDFEELADIQKIIQQNQPEEGDLFYNNNDGFVGFMYDLARTLPESFISMASAAETPLTAGSVAVGATAGSVIPGVGTAVGASSGFAFATSAINEYGTTIMAMLDEEGVDVTSADELRKAFADQELIGRIKKRAGARSGVIGLIDGISGGVAGKLSKKIVGEVGEEVIEELAKGTTKEIIDQATDAGRKITYGEVVETTIESLAGGAGEALGSIAAGQEVSLRDVLLETLADPTSKVVSTGGSKAQSLIDGVSKNLEGKGNITEAQKTLLKLAKNDPKRFQDVIAASQYRNNGEIKAINAKIAAIKLSSDFGQDKSLDKVIGTLQRRKANLQLRTMTELRGATQENINELAEIGREIEDLNTRYKDGSLTGDALAAVKEAINEKLVEFNDKYKEFATDVPAEVGAEAGAVDLEPVTKPEEEVKIDRTLFSDEDTKAVNELEKELVTAVEEKDTKKVQELTTAIIEIENKYRDSKKETGVPSPKQEGETAIKEEPVKEGGVETPETGRVVQELEEVTDAESFSKAIDDARDELSKDERRLDLQVSPVEPKAAKKIVSEGGKIFMSPDRMAGGFVEKDGYIGGIFKDPRSKAKAVAKNVIKQALDNGGKYLDAYATKLEDIYIDLGFRPVARVPFAEEFAPDGWDAPKSVLKGKPDVVFFVYDPENAKGTAGQGTEFTSYDIAKQFASERADQVAAAEDSLELDIILLDKDGARKEASRGAGSDPRNLVRGKMTATFTKDGIIFRTKEDTGRMKSKGGEIFIPNFKINTMPRIWDYERGTPEYAYYVANMMDIADKYEGDPVKLMESKRVKTEDIGKEGTPSARRFNAAKGKAITNMVSNFNKVLKKIGAAPVDIIFVNNSIEYATNYKYITSNEPTGSPRGVYISAGETIDGGAKIIINLDKADVSTIAHEMLHAYIGAVKLDGKKITEFATSMEAELSKGTPAERELAGRLSAFRDQYVKAEVYGKGKTKEDPIIAEEFLAEYVGIMSEHSEGLSPAKQVSFVDKVRSAVVKFLAKLGIVDKSLAAKITNREEAFEFMNGFVDALQGRVEAIKPPAVEKNVNTATKFARYSIKGDFTHTYFDKSEQYQKLVDDGKIVHNSSLGNIAGKAATITQPDSMVTAKVELDGKTIVDGNGGIFFIAKFGDVWAAAKKQAANGLAKMINDSRKKNGGTGYLLLTSGAISKMITSTDGVKASMNILESMVERGLIPVSDFRAALTAVGKKYNVDFSGRDSMKSIHKDIQDKFLNVSDSTFEKRGFFFEDVVDHIAKNSPTAKENITAIRNMLGAQKRISFSKQGIKDAIGYVLAERIIDNLPSGHIYAYVEVNDEVIVEETKDHGSYPFVIKQKNGERPVLHLLSERPKAVEVVNAKDGSSVSDYDKTSMFQGKIGLAQAGRGSVIVSDNIKQQIDWQPNLLGKGKANPAIVNRTTPVQEAAIELLQGKITNAEYQEVVRTTQTIEPITRFFLPASTKDMQGALDSNKAKLLNTPLEDGASVGLRLDIPAYKNWDIWIVSIHDSGKSGKSLSYGSVAWATDVTFGSNPKVAAFIAAGQNLDLSGKLIAKPKQTDGKTTYDIVDTTSNKVIANKATIDSANKFINDRQKQDKTTIARMHGKWKNFEGKTKEERDASAVKKVEEIVAIESSFPGAGRKGSPWRQVGMNPFRHSWFYDRRNGKPVVGASEVVQIGGLVYAKDVLYADKNDMAFEVSGYKDANGDPVRFQLELDDMQIQPAVYKKNIFQKIASQFVFTNVEKQARILFESRQGQVTLAVREARDLARKIRKLANSEELVEMVSNYMEGNNRGEIADKLEKTEKGERLLDLLRNADAMVEGFSESIVDDPAFESLPIELKFAITNNAGTYLKTRYRFFTDKKYKIKDKARAKAIQSERDMIVAREMAVMKRAGLSEDQINEAIQDSLDDINKRAHDSIDLYINKLENIKQAPSVTGTDIKIPSSSFQFKKDIPYHIQELLGVERDPVSRFSATVEAQANILYKGRMVQGLLETSSGLWDEYILDSDPEPSKAPLYKKVKDPYSPLNNKWVHNEIMSIFDRAPLYESDKAWLQGYYSLLKLGRKSKVIWNIPTWRKNLTGGWYFMLANGVLANPRAAKDLKDRLALTLNSDRIMTDPQTKEWLNVMGKKGLLGANVDAQLIGINDAAYTYMYDGDAKAYEKAWRRVRSSVSNMDKWLQEKYSAVDDYTKLVIFRQEVDSFAKKIYGKEYESLTEPQKDRVHDEAAEFVKQNTPTFSRLPKFYDKLAVIPIFGDFASFQLESIRSMSMNIKNGISDMKIAIEGIDENGNKLNEEQKKAYKASAGKRLVGTLSAFALKYAMVAGFEQIFLDEEDEELAKDAKQVTPEWMKGQSLIVRSIDKNGDVRVYNYSSEDPYGTIGDLTTPSGWGSMFNTFVRPNIAADYIFRAVKGEDIYGRKLFDESDTGLQNGLKFMNYTAKTFVVPPFISSSYRDVVKKQENGAIDLFKKPEAAADLLKTIGERSIVRDYKYNILDQFRYSVRDISENKPLKEAGDVEKRYRHLDSVREDYKAIVRIAVTKGNYQMAKDAKNMIKRRFDKEERRYILDGIKSR